MWYKPYAVYLCFILISVNSVGFRSKWVANLKFSHNKEICDLTWDRVEVRLPRTEKLCSVVRAGIPHSLCPQMWMQLSGIVCIHCDEMWGSSVGI